MIHDAELAIAAGALTKSFDGRQVIRGIDVTVPRGEIFGFLGANGAGKTTTMAMLTGMLVPDGGTIQLLGRSMTPNAVAIKRRIGVVTSEPQLFDSLTGAELLQSIAAIYGVPRATAAARIAELVAFFDLEEAMTRVVAHYSHGMRKKLAVAAALIHGPEIVFLDEPFEGMDAAAVDATAILIEQLAANGTTIFITSHRLELIERICTSVAILAAGEIVLSARTSELATAVRTVPTSSRPLLESIFLELTGNESKRSLSWLQQGPVR